VRRTLLIPLCLVLLAACIREEKPADISHPQTYDRNGIRFCYPGNWSIWKDTAEPGFASVIVESVYSLLTLQVYAPPPKLTLEGYADWYMKDRDTGRSEKVPIAGPLKLTYTERPGKEVKITRKTDGRIYEQVYRRFEGSFAGQRVPFICNFVEIPGAHQTVFITMQGPEEDRSLVEPGFRLIRETLSVNPLAGRDAESPTQAPTSTTRSPEP